MITAVELPVLLQAQLRREALCAYPRECCGLLEGYRTPFLLRQAEDEVSKNEVLTLSLSKGDADTSEIAHVVALHPMPNIAQEADRFEIDPAAHIALLRTLRGSRRGIVGCYHSHPNGRAEPSERDRANTDDEGFLWLITAVAAETRAANIAAFVCAAQSFSPVAIVHDVIGDRRRVCPSPDLIGG